MLHHAALEHLWGKPWPLHLCVPATPGMAVLAEVKGGVQFPTGIFLQELFGPEQEGVLELGGVPGWRSSRGYQGVVL